ncbi:MAG TPA: 50S ribosomal protein L9 [Candidatus Moranbacteria bacterium]|nr:50S ribosomal protein L9 [Candidatus Moranbacteria bacterium]
MKVILLQDVKGIGRKGDIKEVSDGYARNFLMPRKLVEMATDSSVKKVEVIKKKEAEMVQADLAKTQELADKLQGREIIIVAKEKDGKLFGSINAKAIAKELKKENFQINDKKIVLPEPIKEIGEHEIKIELEHGIEATIHVVVESA